MKIVTIIIAGLCIVIAVIIAVGIWMVVLPKSKSEAPTSTSTSTPTSTSTSTPAVKVVQQKCKEYAKIACDHPYPKKNNSFSDEDEFSPIRGGMPAVEGMFPHMSFILAETASGNSVCGGTLISEYFVMTAAHCIPGELIADLKVVIGITDLELVLNSTALPNIVYIVDDIFIHTKQDSDNISVRENDIAILKLATKVEFDWKKRPICLNTDYSSIDTKNITASGWGTDETGDMTTFVLQLVDQNTTGEILEECLSMLEWSNLSMICAAHGDASKSVCQGDSGGPLQIPLKAENTCPNTYEQLGIVSRGFINCTEETNEPRVVLYTKVDRFIDWIVSHVWPNE